MTLPDVHEPALPTARKSEFSIAEIGALPHLYRGEVYRSTVWRTRLDSSTNWAVATTGIALSGDLQQRSGITPAHGARRSFGQCVPSVRVRSGAAMRRREFITLVG